jgi:hypothetical protein
MEYYFAFHSITIFFLIGFKSYFSFLFLSMLDLSIVDFSQRDLCDKLFIPLEIIIFYLMFIFHVFEEKKNKIIFHLLIFYILFL